MELKFKIKKSGNLITVNEIEEIPVFIHNLINLQMNIENLLLLKSAFIKLLPDYWSDSLLKDNYEKIDRYKNQNVSALESIDSIQNIKTFTELGTISETEKYVISIVEILKSLGNFNEEVTNEKTIIIQV